MMKFRSSFALLSFCCMCVNALSTSCQGVNEYKDEEGQCKVCESCPPGSQPSTHHCGFGKKDPAYRCVPCEEGSFSSSTDNKFCKSCKPCKMWNALVSVKCSATQDAQCGACLNGYFRHLKSNGKPDEECHKCLDDSTEPECIVTTTPWILILVLSVAGVTVLSVIVACGVVMFCRRSATSKKRETNAGKQRNYSRVTHVLTCANNDDTVNSMSLTPLTSSSDILVDTKPSDSLSQLRDCFNNRQPGGQTSNCNLMEGLSYTQHPTAEYQETSICQLTNYSNLPTAQYHTNEHAPAALRATSQADVGRNAVDGAGASFVPGTPHSNRHDFLQVESFDTSSLASSRHCATYESKPASLLVEDKATRSSKSDCSLHSVMNV